MARSLVTGIDGDFASDAEWRTWGSGLCTQMQTVGFLKTTDTGQINWTTAEEATGGYEIRKLPDVVGGLDVYVKLGFGGGGGKPNFTFAAGTSTDGAGTLTGQYCGNIGSLAEYAGTDLRSMVCMSEDGNGIYVVNAVKTSGWTGCSMFIERTLDAAGNATDDGIYLLGGRNSGSHQQAVVPRVGDSGYNGNTANWPALGDGNITEEVSGDLKVGLWPNMYMALVKPRVTRLLAYANDTIPTSPDGAVIQVNHQGADREYMALGDLTHNVNISLGLNDSAGYARLAMPWEA